MLSNSYFCALYHSHTVITSAVQVLTSPLHCRLAGHQTASSIRAPTHTLTHTLRAKPILNFVPILNSTDLNSTETKRSESKRNELKRNETNWRNELTLSHSHRLARSLDSPKLGAICMSSDMRWDAWSALFQREYRYSMMNRDRKPYYYYYNYHQCLDWMMIISWI